MDKFVSKSADALFDRLMPDATGKEREEARDNLRGFLRALLRVAARHAAEGQSYDSRESDPGCRIPPTPDP
jgi:hypothetical protein